MIVTDRKKAKLVIMLSLTMITLMLSSMIIGSVDAQAIIWTQASNPSVLLDAALGLAVQSSGTNPGLYVVGYETFFGAFGTFAHRWRIEKRDLLTGSLLWVVKSQPSLSDAFAYGAAVDASGLYIVGSDTVLGSTNARWRIEKRSLLNGALLWTGTSNPSSHNDVAYGVAVSSGGVYVVGYDEALGSTNARWRIERRDGTTGVLLASAVSNPSAGNDVARSVTVDSSGVYVAGYDMVGGNARWRIEKRGLSGLALTWTQTSNPSVGNDHVYGVTVGSGGLYLVGDDMAPGNGEWRIERRDRTTGALIASSVSNPSSGNESAYGVSAGSSGLYVVGYDMVGGNARWRIEKRSLSNLAVIWTVGFNPSGSTGDDRIQSVGIDQTGIYMAGYDSALGGSNTEWRIQKRMPSDV